MALVKCSAQDRKGKNFYRASEPSAEIENAPSEIVRALVLMDWACKQSILPRTGSSPYEKLAELLKILSEHAKSLLTEAVNATKEAEKDLERIRKMNWQNIN
jgi:hypothetical protein